MRIAMIGQKGLPASHGGVERHVEEVGSRLAERGHEVTVYCRRSYVGPSRSSYRGMRLRELPSVPTKHLDALSHSAVSALAAMMSRHDVVHFHALGPGLCAPLPRYLSASKVVLTVHGLDNERAKWGRGAQGVLRMGHWMSARVPDATVVVSRALRDHYESRFARSTVYIPNGVTAPAPAPAGPACRRLELEPGGYVLFVGRLVPEKACDVLLRAFAQLPSSVRLVLAGDSSFTDDYVATLHELAAADRRVVLAGYVYGDDLRELYDNAAAFVLPSLLEGLPLTLLEAASYGVPVVASDIPPHREVVGTDAPGHRLVPPGDVMALAAAIGATLTDPLRARSGALRLRDQVLDEYRWDDVTDRLESLYRALLGDVRKAAPVELTGVSRP